MKTKVLLGLALLTTGVMATTVVAQNIKPSQALLAKQNIGSATEYSVSLVLRADYNDDTKYFSYNDTYHYASVSDEPVEYRLDFTNGDSKQFSIFNGSKYLDINTEKNLFVESDTPVYWGKSTSGIGRTLNGVTKFLYYNNSSPRIAPYADKIKQDGSLTTNYAIGYFYSSEQLESWKTHCSGSFAEACLTTLISGNFIPSEGETPIEPVVEGIVINPSDGAAVESSDYTITKTGVTVQVTASTLTADQIRVFKGKTITISATGITKIEFTCTANGTAKYGPGCFAALEGYTFEENGKKGTWTGLANSVTFTASTNQVRITQIVVTLAA